MKNLERHFITLNNPNGGNIFMHKSVLCSMTVMVNNWKQPKYPKIGKLEKCIIYTNRI